MAVSHQEPHTPRQILSSLIHSIPATSPAQRGQNPLRDLNTETRNIFLTLYAQFEKEFLPALDLLDRGLVTRVHVQESNPDDTNSQNKSSSKSIYLVRSAQQHHTRHGSIDHANHYEVRLEAWSCSCPAFTFSAFPAEVVPSPPPRAGSNMVFSPDEAQCIFGGVTRGEDTPVCKHLLACVLVQNCGMFAGFVEEREVSVEELTGWAAGLGD
jgi:hypothetical protein